MTMKLRAEFLSCQDLQQSLTSCGANLQKMPTRPCRTNRRLRVIVQADSARLQAGWVSGRVKAVFPSQRQRCAPRRPNHSALATGRPNVATPPHQRRGCARGSAGRRQRQHLAVDGPSGVACVDAPARKGGIVAHARIHPAGSLRGFFLFPERRLGLEESIKNSHA